MKHKENNCAFAKDLVAYAEDKCGHRLLLTALKIPDERLLKLALEAGAKNSPEKPGGVTPFKEAVNQFKPNWAIMILKKTHSQSGLPSSNIGQTLDELLPGNEAHQHFLNYSRIENHIAEGRKASSLESKPNIPPSSNSPSKK
jgi:hypothetical protein